MARITLVLEDIENEDGTQGLGFHLFSDPPLPENALDVAELGDDLTSAHLVASHLTLFYQGYLAPQFAGHTLKTAVESVNDTVTAGPVETASAVAKMPNGDYCPFPELLSPTTRESLGVDNPNGPNISIVDESQETPPE